MADQTIGSQPVPATKETRWRFRFSVATAATTVLLLAWGGFVTSIDAGMAFPDWPTSLGSYNWLNPVDRWWAFMPYLAEHGHRLIASLVGILTVVLAVWTWRADPRRWMRRLGFGALVLVIVQGVLGGLRVVFVSLDLALVHALVAQLFFATIVAMTLFTSSSWLQARSIPERSTQVPWLRRWTKVTAAAVYIQIVLGAFLRHPGAGVHAGFAATHITGAFVIVALVVLVWARTYKHLWKYDLLRRGANVMLATVGVQFALGLAAYVVLLYETEQALRSAWQVTLNSLHLVVGAILFASTIVLALLAARRPAVDRSTTRISEAASPDQPVASAAS